MRVGVGGKFLYTCTLDYRNTVCGCEKKSPDINMES